MKWTDFYRKFRNCPLLSPEMLYATSGKRGSLQVQLSRWVKEGKLIKLAQGKYLLAPPFQKGEPSVIAIANQLQYPSYVSLEYALGHYGLIPEALFTVTSVTARRTASYQTPLGTFAYRHIKHDLFWGYGRESEKEPEAMIASPEKALLDLFYYWSGKVTLARIVEMRFQNFGRIDLEKLRNFSRRSESKKLQKIVEKIFIPYWEREHEREST